MGNGLNFAHSSGPGGALAARPLPNAETRRADPLAKVLRSDFVFGKIIFELHGGLELTRFGCYVNPMLGLYPFWVA